MLGNIIQKREDNKEIIEVVHNDEDSFLSLFDSFSSNYKKKNLKSALIRKQMF